MTWWEDYFICKANFVKDKAQIIQEYKAELQEHIESLPQWENCPGYINKQLLIQGLQLAIKDLESHQIQDKNAPSDTTVPN